MHENDVLLTIREVQEGGKHLANWYLSNGYVLLEIQLGARTAWFPHNASNGGQAYVRRNPIYVLGRPEGVNPAPGPPPFQQSTEVAPAQ